MTLTVRGNTGNWVILLLLFLQVLECSNTPTQGQRFGKRIGNENR